MIKKGVQKKGSRTLLMEFSEIIIFFVLNDLINEMNKIC